MSNSFDPTAIEIDLGEYQTEYGIVQPWFPTLIYFKDDLHIDKLEEWSEIAKQNIENPLVNSRYANSLEVKSTHGVMNLLQVEELTPLWDTITNHSQWFVNYMGYLKFRVQLVEAWANISVQNDYLFPHKHPASFLSGAFYLKSSPSDDIMFMQEPTLFRPNYPTELTYDKVTYECSAGRLILFKSDTMHGVTRQKSPDEKIVISFNLIGEYQ